MPPRAITVYCSSSSKVAHVYFDAARGLGRAIAMQHWQLIYGGNDVGLMKTLADAARAAGGAVIGITPQLLVDKGISALDCHELIVTVDMRTRKALMEQRGDAFIALPGGIGTLEEFFEILVARQLGFHTKPIVLLNIANYFRPLIDMLDHGIDQKFIKPGTHAIYHVADTVDDAMAHLRSSLNDVLPATAAKVRSTF